MLKVTLWAMKICIYTGVEQRTIMIERWPVSHADHTPPIWELGTAHEWLLVHHHEELPTVVQMPTDEYRYIFNNGY